VEEQTRWNIVSQSCDVDKSCCVSAGDLLCSASESTPAWDSISELVALMPANPEDLPETENDRQNKNVFEQLAE